MSTKPKILVFVDWFLPGKNAGGPIRSVANIIETLQDDFDFHVVTSAFDFGADSAYDGIETDAWTKFQSFTVWYSSKMMSADLIKSFLIKSRLGASLTWKTSLKSIDKKNLSLKSPMTNLLSYNVSFDLTKIFGEFNSTGGEPY